MALDVHWKARLISLGLIGAAGIAGWYILSPGHRVSYEIDTREAVSGLTEGAPVEMHGVEIGTVRRMRLADPATVHLVLSIDRDAPITRATTAVLTARGLAARGFMGYVYIALENTGADGRPLGADANHTYPVIPMAAPQSDTIDTTAVAAIQEVRTLTQLIQTLLEPSMRSSLKESVHDARELLALLVTNEGRLEALLGNIERDTQQVSLLLDEKDRGVPQAIRRWAARRGRHACRKQPDAFRPHEQCRTGQPRSQAAAEYQWLGRAPASLRAAAAAPRGRRRAGSPDPRREAAGDAGRA